MVTTNNFDKLRELNQKADAGGGEERARRREVEDKADRLEDLLIVGIVTVWICNGPRRLYAERRLEVGLW